MRAILPAVLLLTLLCGAASELPAQPRVDARNRYERIMAIVPFVGQGTFTDPKRPMYAPTPAQIQLAKTSGRGIIAFTYVASDDSTRALVEYVARDPTAFRQILADATIATFLKGRDPRAAVEAAFLQHKKNFNFALFGVRMP